MITPAMRRWIKDIAAGRCTIRRTNITGARASGIVGGGGFTYVMGARLEDAGLIRWEPPNALVPGTATWACPTGDSPQTAVLTDAGKAVANG